MTMNEAEFQRVQRLGVWTCFATAVHFLTRVTISKSLATREDFDHARALNRAVVFFPVVGGLLGVFTASLLTGFVWLGIPSLLAAFLALGVEAYVTGAFHEDAFADTCDALGGGWTQERVLEIMKDSRLGTYGTISLVIGVSCRGLATEATSAQGALWTFASVVAASMIARFVIVVFMATTAPIASRHSQARDVSGTQSASRVMLSALIASPFAIGWIALFPWVATYSLIACLGVVVWYRNLVLRRLEGTTGDILGASGYLAQLVIMIGASVA
ncbi:MAG: adenosylcobinamide-GDP ribazoletransferase [Planctomycetota bacterium]